MSDQHSFPQDWATGLQETVDWNDAGSFANLADHPNVRGYVADGLEFDVDFSTNILRIDPGRAFVWQETTYTNDHRDDDGPDEKELIGGAFVTQRGASGDINLVDNEVNYVWIHVNQLENDHNAYQVNTSGIPPNQPYLRLGRVDTENDSYVEENRTPSTSTRRLVVTGQTHGDGY